PDTSVLALRLARPGAHHARTPELARRVVEIDADDVGQPPGKSEDLRRPAADHDRRSRLLDGTGQTGEPVGMHELAVEIHLLAREVSTQHRDVLRQLGDPDARTR